jgi:hypothetical protein
MRRRIKQPHEVRHLDGRAINWKRPPGPNKMCVWTKRTSGGKVIRGTFRHLCHLNRLNNLALAKYGTGIVIIQSAWNTTVAASAGTHDKDAVVDLYIPGVGWWEQQRFFRANGLGCWYRHPPLFGNHIHGFTLPVPEGRSRGDDFAMQGTPVGLFVPGQLEDYYREAFGLSGQHTPGSDNSWFPRRKEDTVFNLKRYVEHRARLAA